MKFFQKDLKDSKGNDAFGLVDRDGNVYIEANIRHPLLQKFVSKHEGRHKVQLQEHHDRHKHFEALAVLEAIKHAETDEGKRGLAISPQTDDERELQENIRELVRLYKKNGGGGKKKGKSWWDNPEAARKAEEEYRSSGNPETE